MQLNPFDEIRKAVEDYLKTVAHTGGGDVGVPGEEGEPGVPIPGAGQPFFSFPGGGGGGQQVDEDAVFWGSIQHRIYSIARQWELGVGAGTYDTSTYEGRNALGVVKYELNSIRESLNKRGDLSSPMARQAFDMINRIEIGFGAYGEGTPGLDTRIGGGGGGGGSTALSYQERLGLLGKENEYALALEKMRIEQQMRQLRSQATTSAAQLESAASLGVLGELATHATSAIVPGQQHYYGWQPGGPMSQLASMAGQQFTPRAAVGTRPPWEMPLQQAAAGAAQIRGSI